MSKRADGKFARVPRDFYMTPRAAVLPLVPYLRAAGVRTFVEPCAGAGDLVRHLESFDFVCTEYGDIDMGRDALLWTHLDIVTADVCVTNTPWEHDLMAAIMERFACLLPSWFLISIDWLATRQAARLLAEYATDVVPIGRLKWVPGSAHTGFDNCVWVRMHKDKDSGPVPFWPMTPRRVK